MKVSELINILLDLPLDTNVLIKATHYDGSDEVTHFEVPEVLRLTYADADKSPVIILHAQGDYYTVAEWERQ